jgi:hypothetical protein
MPSLSMATPEMMLLPLVSNTGILFRPNESRFSHTDAMTKIHALARRCFQEMHGVGFTWGSGGRKCPQTSTLHGIVWKYTPCADQVTHELNTSQSVVRVVLALLTYKPELNMLRVFSPPKEHYRKQPWKGRAL